MSNFDVSYCAEADLRTIYPNIAKYGKKRVVAGWVADSALTDRYKSGSVGSISQLYKDGIELGSAEANLAAVTSNGKWYYDSDLDVVYYFNSADNPNELDIAAGTDWSTLVADVILRASNEVSAIIGKPIFKHRDKDNNYDSVIVHSTAALACGFLIRPSNKELADSLELRYNNDFDEFPKGILQKIRDSEISLSSEINPALGVGILVEDSLNSSTTGGIDDIRGSAIDNDTLEISIVNGGTFSYGTANTTITYQVKGKSSTGLMTSTFVSATAINGDYQTLTNGMELRFVPGVYTTGDSWYVKISREEVETHQAINSVIATSAW